MAPKFPQARRTAHVYRIYKTDKQGKITDPDVWVDVMRFDAFRMSEDRGSPTTTRQERSWYLRWGDDTVASTSSPQRKYEDVKATENLDQSSSSYTPKTITIPSIKAVRLNEWRGGQSERQAGSLWFLSKGEHRERKTTTLRIENNDLNYEIGFQDVAVGDPQPPTDPLGSATDWDDYFKALQDGNIDKSQSLDFDVIDSFPSRFQSPYDKPPARGVEINVFFVNKQGLGNSELGVEDWFSSSNDGPDVTSLDPFQIVVNVNWGALAVEFGDTDQDAP